MVSTTKGIVIFYIFLGGNNESSHITVSFISYRVSRLEEKATKREKKEEIEWWPL